jgi:hypothetical protein
MTCDWRLILLVISSHLSASRRSMKREIIISLPLLLFSQIGVDQEALTKAATRYVPGVSWRARSVVTADFTCRGRLQTAILDASPSEIVVAVFLNGTNSRPEVPRSSAKVRDPASATLQTESLDYDPKEDPGYVLPGFQRSKTCKGLNLSDGEIDSAHIYWNHESLRFDGWVR